MTNRTLLAAVPILVFLLACCASVSAAEPPDSSLQEALRKRLENPPLIPAVGAALHAGAALPDFYQRRLYRPAWIQGEKPAPAAAELLSALAEAQNEGLDPDHYHRQAIQALLTELSDEKPSVERLGDLDLLLTDAFLVLATHYRHGRINPETIDPEWHARRRGGDPGEDLDQALIESVRRTLQNMLPAQPEYAGLKQQLLTYRSLAAAGGWAPIPAGGLLRAGDSGSRVAALRSRLLLTGDLMLHTGGDFFDAEVSAALRRFQHRHGLTADGVLGPATLAALNVPVEARLHQIEVNLERWRWLPADLGDRHVLVNIADFHLYAVEKGETVLDMRVVVGRPYRQTPVFSDRIRYIVFNPYWEVPEQITVKDILPRIVKDPAHLGRLQMKLLQGWGNNVREIDPALVNWSALGTKRFPYRLRQDPGPNNPLGRIKFMFPNAHDIYLHDTPARQLFARDRRSLSSGCIRLEKPLELAEYLLRGSRIGSRSALEQRLAEHKESSASLPQPVPVHILYRTAWVDRQGALHFRPDIYGRDHVLRQALDLTPDGGMRRTATAKSTMPPGS
ncbi:MAG: L,D-transpeptidase family protein [Desulfuromonadales bacterium]